MLVLSRTPFAELMEIYPDLCQEASYIRLTMFPSFKAKQLLQRANTSPEFK